MKPRDARQHTGSERVTAAGTGILIVLRIAIGWHFLYQGLDKLLVGEWTARSYLATADGPLASVFRWLAETPTALAVVDLANMWGQVLVGLGLMLGLLTPLSCAAGAALLALYYVAHPPAFAVVDTNLIELIALIVLAVIPTGSVVGLDRLVIRWRSNRSTPDTAGPGPEPRQAVELPVEGREPGAPLADRRELLKGLAGLPFVAAAGTVTAARQVWLSHEERNLVDAFTEASRKALTFETLDQLKAPVPRARIGDKEVSRIILGGNIICGFAHSRDLIYVSELVRAYHTPKKIYESLMLAERCGINTILTHPSIAPAINAYWSHYGGKIQFLADCGWMKDMDTLGAIDYAIDHGAGMCYLQGEAADSMVREGKWDYLDRCLQRVRDQGLPMGIGAHRIETLRAIAEKGISPDFWMKTFHPHNYWSARHPEEHDNKYCYKPEETIAFMRERREPWIAFKTMAAGAIRPRDAFCHAFENGADFVCAGMYDFQMVEDANHAVDILADGGPRRERPWMAEAVPT